MTTKKPFLLLLLFAVSFLVMRGGGESVAVQKPDICFVWNETATGGVEIISYNKDADPACDLALVINMEIPPTLGGKPVTSIGKEVFHYAYLSKLTLPDSLESIGDLAFMDAGISNVKFPASLKSIGESAFAKNHLESIDLPSGITRIADSAFQENKLTSLTLRDTIVEIGDSAFAYNELTELTLPSSLQSIGDGAFIENQLTGVVIPNSVTSIGDLAFAKNQLTNVVIPGSVTSIGDGVFYENQLTGVVIPNSVTSIGDRAFGTNQLISIIIPEKVESIGDRAFYNNQLTDVIIPNSVKTIKGGAFTNNHLTSIVLSDAIERIENDVFAKNQLTGVVIPNSVTSIGDRAFAENKLTSVYIPIAVTTIGKEAFTKNQLTGVRMPDSVMKIDLNAFADNPGLSAHSGQVEAIIAKDYRTITGYDLANLHWLRICHLDFNLDGGSWTGVMSLTGRENDPFPVLPLPEKPGYAFDGRDPEFPPKITGDQTFKALWQQLYTLYFDLDGGVGTTVLTGFYHGDAFPTVPDPVKTGYIFSGWNPILPSTVTETKTYKALWEPASSPTPGGSSGGSSGASSGGSSGGGGGSSLRRDNCPNGDYSPSYYDGSCGTSTATGSIATGSVSTETQKADSLKDEQTQAYERAYQQGITTISGAEQARLGESITRAELAKMMSVYAMKVLGKTPILTGVASYPDLKGIEGDLPSYVQLVYQLQIMGIESDGSPLAEFNPNGTVSRAEFGTALSRVLWGDKYNQAGEIWYEKHLNALKTAGIMHELIPGLQELRGWIMLMLMRAEANK